MSEAAHHPLRVMSADGPATAPAARLKNADRPEPVEAGPGGIGGLNAAQVRRRTWRRAVRRATLRDPIITCLLVVGGL
jgi:hypothetical protein